MPGAEMIVSRHPSAVLTNPYPMPGGAPRVLGEDVEELVGRYPNVVLWLAGHTGRNSILPKPGAAGTKVNTAKLGRARR